MHIFCFENHYFVKCHEMRIKTTNSISNSSEESLHVNTYIDENEDFQRLIHCVAAHHVFRFVTCSFCILFWNFENMYNLFLCDKDLKTDVYF